MPKLISQLNNFDMIQDGDEFKKIVVDETPTEGSPNAVSSGGVFDALANSGGGNTYEVPAFEHVVTRDEQETTKASMEMGVSTFNKGATTLPLPPSSYMIDGTLADCRVTTTAANGYFLNTTTTSGYDNLSYDDTKGNILADIAYINSHLKTCTDTSAGYIRFRGSGSATRTFSFDFKRERKLTFNVYIREYQSYYSATFYGSNDNATWETIGDVPSETNVSLTPSKKYRYYKLEVTDQIVRLYYMYFTSITDYYVTITTENKFTLGKEPVENKLLLVRTSNEVDTTDIAEASQNTLDGVELSEVLNGNCFYDLVYNGAKYQVLNNVPLAT